MTSSNLPAGTPTGETEAGSLAPVWCACGVRWTPTAEGYRPDRADAAHPDIPCRPASAIPCGPVTPFDPAEFPNSGPAAVEQATAKSSETTDDRDLRAQPRRDHCWDTACMGLLGPQKGERP